jgi:hypothetical protein
LDVYLGNKRRVRENKNNKNNEIRKMPVLFVSDLNFGNP